LRTPTVAGAMSSPTGHPDCCGGGDDHDPLGCPLCGQRGHGVPPETVDAFVPEAHREESGSFWFCDTPECAVAFYPPGCGAPVFVSELPVPTGVKAPFSDTAPLCHCFGITRGEVVARAASDHPASAEVAERMKSEGCACAIKNPTGQCCLGDVRAVEGAQTGQKSGTVQ